MAASGRPNLLTAPVSPSCTVLIAAQAVLPALTDRASADGSDVLAFSDADALKALEAIITHHPSIVALERLFAVSARGVALISRIKADLALSPCEVRVVSQEIESEAVRSTPVWQYLMISSYFTPI